MNRQWLIKFLEHLKEEIPPPTGMNHCLMTREYGSEETGWRTELGLQIACEGKDNTVCECGHGTGLHKGCNGEGVCSVSQCACYAFRPVTMGAEFHCLFLEDGDFSETPEDLARTCARILRAIQHHKKTLKGN